MAAGKPSVDEHLRLVIHRAKMQKHGISELLGRNGKAPQQPDGGNEVGKPYAGKRAFRTEGHCNRPVKRGAFVPLFLPAGE